MSLLIESAIKTSLIVLLGLFMVAFLRKQSAALRHWLLAVVMFCAALVPIVGAVVPSWHLWLASSTPRSQFEAVTEGVIVSSPPSRGEPSIPLRQVSNPIRLAHVEQLLVGTWVAGAVIGIGILIVGLARLAWLAAVAHRVVDERWTALADEVSRAFRLRWSIALLQSNHPAMLVTWGLTRPKVMLPAGAREWPDDRVRVALAHELAHVRRADWIVQIAAEFLRSIYWFNPLLWIACRRLRQESEHACDDAVLNLGVEGSEYAAQLLDLARAVGGHRRAWLPAPAMAHTSSLERRVKAMLNANLDRTPITRLVRAMTVALLLAVAIPIAGFKAFAQAALATFSGSVFDATNLVIPNATLALTNVETKARNEVRSDPSGHFEFVGLPPGNYVLESRTPGFKTALGNLTLVGRNIAQDVTLQIGSLEEHINVRDSNVSTSIADRGSVQKRDATGCTGLPPVGGNIRPPRKVRDVRPIYPSNLRGTGAEGTVVLDARIGTDGDVREVRTVRSPDPDFERAAIEAVRRWEFDWTLLNCVPVEVEMRVTVSFTPQR